MQRLRNHRRDSWIKTALIEAIEPRMLFAYVSLTSVTGPSNPFGTIAAGSGAAPVLADFNADGRLDMFIGSADGMIRQYVNTGTALSPTYVVLPVFDIGDAAAPALGDLDNDGDLDFVIGELNGTLVHYRNTGTATNGFLTLFSGAGNPLNGVDVGSNSTPALADLDHDGDLDCIIGAADGALRYLKNTGTPTSPVFTLQSGAANPFDAIDVGNNSAPTFVDVDHDGDLDAFVGSSDGTLRGYRNTGTPTAPVFVQMTGTANPANGFSAGGSSVPSFGDIDADGDMDAIVGAGDGGVRFLRNGLTPPTVNPQEQAGTANPLGTVNLGTNNSIEPEFGDLDGDGDLDALVGSGDGAIRYYKNTGSPTSPVYTIQTNAANPFNAFNFEFDASPALCDLDGDGDLDVAVGSFNGDLRYLLNTGNATTPTYIEPGGASNPFNGFSVGGLGLSSVPALGDLDGDGDLDAVVGSFEGILLYLKNTGDATNPVYVVQNGAANPFNNFDIGFGSSPALADLDNDGDLDAVVATGEGTLVYFKNTGTAIAPTFAQQAGAANPYGGIDVGGGAGLGFGDLDSDGDPDAMIGEFHGVLFYFRTNRAPVVDNAIPDQTFTGPGSQSYTVSADTFADLENSALTYSATLTSGATLPAWLSFNAETRQFSGNPVRLEPSPIQIRVTANDGQGGNGFDDFQLTLSNVGDPPVATNDSYSINQDAVLTANGIAPNPAGVLANDNDPEGFALSAGVLTQPANGTVIMSLNGTFTYTPAAGYNGPDSFTYQAGNGVLVSNTATVSINVNDTSAPTVQQSQFLFDTAPQKLTVKFNENVSASLAASDFIVMHAVTTAPVPFTLSYDTATNTATLTLSGILTDDDYLFRVKAAGVTDAAGNPMAADHDLLFFFLAGDANHDRKVDVTDLGILASNWQQTPRTFSQGDFDYTGTVDVADLGILATAWQKELVPPAAPPALALRGPLISRRIAVDVL